MYDLTAECPSGIEFGSSCYQFGTKSIPFDDAKAACEPQGHLVYIEWQEEQTFLAEQSQAFDPESDIWIGLTMDGEYHYTGWIWMNGVSLPFWDKDAVDDDVPCFRMKAGSDYAWTDKRCSSSNGYICELEIGK